ncbi:hypothetical protein IE077_004094 [Cardiosporidium cionae]|uniref:Uncharacterized protein n=1 Tax=Cardiosporidium cionae TaxID=476202 RepID=A0ABQ7JE51_9APIC|nr:hypothetical protein IE077_004094 [Cardiosporidium cionae]|eukprot:KAF8822293.1 hypothetical protein IE077_004094 [Cardiosporidium cionae]
MESTCKKPNRIALDDSVIQSLAVSRAFKDSCTPLNSMDWDKDGDFLITSSEDESIYLYSSSSGECSRTLHSRKGGAEVIRFVHQNNKQCVCVAKTTTDTFTSSIKCWDIVENAYIHNFSLPASTIRHVGLSMHPHRAMMLSSCADSTVRLFTLDNAQPLVKIHASVTSPVASFDTEGFIFACYLGNRKLHLYDCNNYSKGEFHIFDLRKHLRSEEHVTVSNSVTFSTDGKSIVVSTLNGQLLRLDSFTGEVVQNFSADGLSTTGQPFPCIPTISPDSKYLICGGTNKCTHIWRLGDGVLVAKLAGHAGAPLLSLFNPKKALLATAGLNLAWWQPDMNANQII